MVISQPELTLDENGDGFITVEEFKTFYEKESDTFNAR